MRILHISYDYPDYINPDKTRAIASLINGSSAIAENYYISLNRIADPRKEKTYYLSDGVSLSTFGLPKGILFRYTLFHSVKRVLLLGLDFNIFDLVHAHKLTFEGPIAFYLFRKFNVPYIISIQQTDFKLLAIRQDLKSYYKSILRFSKKIIIISPWMKQKLKKVLGSTFFNLISSKIVILPLIVEPDELYNSENNNKFVTAFNMKKGNIRIKNIKRLLLAIRELKKKEIQINLDIIGDGAGKSYIESLISKFHLKENIRLLGEVENQEIVKMLSKYKAFVLCSYPETFGMVYVEALNAGIPIIYSQNAGIDGFFYGMNIGIGVKYNSIKSIYKALIQMIENYEVFKANVCLLKYERYLDIFHKENIIKNYSKIIELESEQYQ